MSMMDSLKNFFMPEDDEEMTTPSSSTTESDLKQDAPAPSNPTPSSYSRPTSSYMDETPRETREPRESRESRRGDRYATIKATAQFQVVLVKATTYTADSKKVADFLMQNKTVVLNLEDISESEKRRIIDFVVGAAYAMHGRIRPIANQTFLIIPQNVGFDGDDIVGELQDNGLV